MDIREEIRDFIVEHFLFGEDDGDFADNHSLTDGGIVDSTGVLELIDFLEEKYQIEIADHEFIPANLDSVDKLVDLVRRKQSS